MSRIGKQPIPVPSGVEVTIDGSTVRVKGPKGELSQTFNEDMGITLDDGVVTVTVDPSILTSTPDGTGMGCLPIRDTARAPSCPVRYQM